jgi:hypothetical protein
MSYFTVTSMVYIQVIPYQQVEHAPINDAASESVILVVHIGTHPINMLTPKVRPIESVKTRSS